MDTIHIENLRFSGKHGVYDHERNKEQEFVIEIKISCDLSSAGKSDNLKDTIDYGSVKNLIQHKIEQTTQYLIEKIAQDISDQVLAFDLRIKEVAVTIKKTEVWDNGVPGVTITRGRSVV